MFLRRIYHVHIRSSFFEDVMIKFDENIITIGSFRTDHQYGDPSIIDCFSSNDSYISFLIPNIK